MNTARSVLVAMRVHRTIQRAAFLQQTCRWFSKRWSGRRRRSRPNARKYAARVFEPDEWNMATREDDRWRPGTTGGKAAAGASGKSAAFPFQRRRCWKGACGRKRQAHGWWRRHGMSRRNPNRGVAHRFPRPRQHAGNWLMRPSAPVPRTKPGAPVSDDPGSLGIRLRSRSSPTLVDDDHRQRNANRCAIKR